MLFYPYATLEAYQAAQAKAEKERQDKLMEKALKNSNSIGSRIMAIFKPVSAPRLENNLG